MGSNQKLTRLKKEMEGIKKHPSPGLHIYWEDDSKLDNIKVEMTGPEGSPYAGSTFILNVVIPDRYPFIPPTITFQTPIYHPNVDPNGRICLEALKPKPTGAWNVTLNIVTVLASIRILLKEPNLSDPLMSEIAQEYTENYQIYFKKASEFNKK